MDKIKKTKKKVKNYYQENEAYHDRLKKQSRLRYQKDPKYKKATLERAKKRYYEDEAYREATIKRGIERYYRLKMIRSTESELAQFFLRNGYIRYPNKNLLKTKERDYKKGYEVRLVANNKKELQKISSLIRKLQLNLGKSFQKNNRYVQPIYGKDAVDLFLKLSKTYRRAQK